MRDLRQHEQTIKVLESTLNRLRSEMWEQPVLTICQQEEFQELCGVAEINEPMAPRKAAENIASAIMVKTAPTFGFEVRKSIVETFGK